MNYGWSPPSVSLPHEFTVTPCDPCSASHLLNKFIHRTRMTPSGHSTPISFTDTFINLRRSNDHLNQKTFSDGSPRQSLSKTMDKSEYFIMSCYLMVVIFKYYYLIKVCYAIFTVYDVIAFFKPYYISFL